MASEGPETRLIKKMLAEVKEKYGTRQTFFKHHGGPYAKAGVSDLIGTVDGVFVAVEVKAPESYGGSVERALREGPTVKQRAYVARVQMAGGVAGFAATVEQFMFYVDQAAEHAADGGLYAR